MCLPIPRVVLQVMLCANLSRDPYLVNGSRGVVVGYIDGSSEQAMLEASTCGSSTTCRASVPATGSLAVLPCPALHCLVRSDAAASTSTVVLHLPVPGPPHPIAG